jgi:hypothetical protein
VRSAQLYEITPTGILVSRTLAQCAPGKAAVHLFEAPIFPASLLRNIARAAACHIYSDGRDVVYANPEFLGVYSPDGGKRTIQLREPSDVLNLLTNETVATGASEFSMTLDPNTMLLLKVGKPEQRTGQLRLRESELGSR